jgi:hypothetical protein
MIDLMDWNYKELPPNYFVYIHASPPCTHYSCARTTAKTPRDLEGSNALVARTLEIIEYFNPRFYTIENPQSGLLKNQPMMQGLKYNDVDYCKYGYRYRKRTRFWNNFSEEWKPQLLCGYHSPCDNLIFQPNSKITRHKEHAQRGHTVKNEFKIRHSQHELYSIPINLVHEILVLIERLNAT